VVAPSWASSSSGARCDPRGLGILIDLYTSRLWGEQTYAAIIVAALLSLVFFWSFGLLRKAVVGRWYQGAR
jgi:ABC-type nitrate/sulfonate/bicarbonate transport system permease component